MTRTVFTRLKDGRIPGVLTRRLLNALIERPTRIVSPDELRPLLWPDGSPPLWRKCVAQQGKHLDRILGGGAVERIGSKRRLDGFRLHVAKLPNGNLTSATRSRSTYARWQLNEEAIVSEKFRDLPLVLLTQEVNRVGGHTRTMAAVEAKLYALGLSKVRPATYSLTQLAAILGTHTDKVVQWIERGLLVATRERSTRGATYRRHPGKWTIRHADAEAFIRACPWELDWRAMQPGHALTILATATLRRNPYLTIAQAARIVGVTENCLWQRIAAGYVPGVVRVTPAERTSDPSRATIRIPASSVAGMPARLPKGPRRRAS